MEKLRFSSAETKVRSYEGYREWEGRGCWKGKTERTPVSVHTPVTDTKETGASQLDISTADKLLVNK